MKKYTMAVVGATGLVGGNIIQVLQERNFPVDKMYFFASEASVGRLIPFRGEEYAVQALSSAADCPIDIAIFSAGGAVSKEYAPKFAQNGCIVIDNSSFWRMDSAVPLMVPDVNAKDIHNHKGIIANPNCSTIQAVMALAPIHKKFGIKRIAYTTYQAVSGAGAAGLQDLEQKTANKFPCQIFDNIIPQVDIFTENGYTAEEMKMINETKKILAADMDITATCVRVPITNCHSESISIEMERDFELGEIAELLESAPNVVYSSERYFTPSDANGTDSVFVSRLRRDFSVKNGLHLWVVADNLRVGAATNAVRIAEKLIGG